MISNNFGLIFFTVLIFVGAIKAESCVECSSERDIKCAIGPAIIEPTECSRVSTECYTRVVGSHVLRGCADQLDQHVRENCTAEQTCAFCSNLNGARGCNNGVFPAHRLACHQCKGNLNSTCSEQFVTQNPDVCPLYNSTDSCYIRRTDKEVQRGCLSSDNNCQNTTQCYTCTGHGCNFLVYNHPSVPVAPSSASPVQSSLLILCGLFILTKLFY